MLMGNSNVDCVSLLVGGTVSKLIVSAVQNIIHVYS